VPGVERQPLKKLAVDESTLLKLLYRWREEAEKAGRRIERIPSEHPRHIDTNRADAIVRQWIDVSQWQSENSDVSLA
jgi:hypothetical protein